MNTFLFGIGTPEIIVIVLVILLLFGGKSFKEGINGIEKDIEKDVDVSEEKKNNQL